MSHRSRFLACFAAASVAASLMPTTSVAQAPDSAKRGGLHARLAGGVDAMLYDGSQRVPSVFGLVGVEWLHPRAPFSARFDLSYFRRDRDFGDRECGGYCVYADRYAVAGVSLDGRYTFFHRAPMRPYLVSGFGLYRSTLAWTANVVCADNTCTATPGQRSTIRDASLGLGLHAGFGFAFAIRRSELTLEFLFREHTASFRQGHNMPVTLGIRF